MPRTVYTVELLEQAAKECLSFTGIARLLGRSPTGSNITHIQRMCKKLNIDTLHFTGQAHNKGKPSRNKRAASDILVLGNKLNFRQQSYLLRRALIEIGRCLKCELCGLVEEWNGRYLKLQIDHKNEQYWDNRAENLRFVCPNCHHQETNKYE